MCPGGPGLAGLERLLDMQVWVFFFSPGSLFQIHSFLHSLVDITLLPEIKDRRIIAETQNKPMRGSSLWESEALGY